MAVTPTTRSSFTSTVWNSPGKATHSVNGAKFGGPNVRIMEGSKIQFSSGSLVWDVARVFEDGTLYLTTVSSGRRMTRRVEPHDKAWTDLWMVDGKRLRTLGQTTQAREAPTGGGPNRNIQPGNMVTLGLSQIRWTVNSILRDGTLQLIAYTGERLTQTEVGPKSKFWNSIYSVSS